MIHSGRDARGGWNEAAALFAPATATARPRVLVIAELGVNHDGDPARAIELVHAAADAGADAIKIQWFHPDRLLSNQALLAAYQEGQAQDQHELLEALTLSVDAVHAIADAARRRGLRFIATLFSPDDAEELSGFGVDAVKIASPDAVNPPLLRAAAALELPMLVSTGTCTLPELEPLATVLHDHGPGGCMLHCVSAYPVPEEAAALGAIPLMQEHFGLPVGYSDHTPDLLTGALAVVAGAVVIEKHFTYDRHATGPDHSASLDEQGLRTYIGHVRRAEAMLGPRAKARLPVEADVAKVSRQSVCAVRDLPAGHTLQRRDLTVKRPGTGIPAAQLESLLGRRLARAVRANDLLQQADVPAAQPSLLAG